MVFLSDPAEVREVFAAPADVLHPGEGGSLLTPIVGTQSWMMADGERHLSGRVLLKEAFTVATAQRHRAPVREIVDRELGDWPTGRTVALHPLLRALALRVVVQTIFGERPDERVDELYGLLLRMLETTASLVLSVPPVRRLPHGRATWRAFLRTRDEVDRVLFDLIRERRSSGEDEGTLAVLLRVCDGAGEPLSGSYVRDSVMSVVVAGHETTSSALAWTLLLVAHRPDVQDRLADDVRHDGEDPFLRATIYESLRHRPVFAFAIPRVVKQSIQIGAWRYEPPTYLMPCIYLIHHDATFYPEPNRFVPERFLEGRPDPTVWLPWGGGRRRCPGRHFALVEMETVVRAVVERFRLRAASDHLERGQWRSFIVTPGAGARVMLESR